MKFFLLFIFSLFIVVIGYSQTTTTTVATGSAGSFKVPCGVTTLTIELWGAGAGGGGGNGSSRDAGGGGGGGGYSKFNSIAVTAGTTYNYTVGIGGSGGASGAAAGGTNGGLSQIIIGATTYSANGGNKGNRATSGAGGTGGAAVAAASVKFTGGNGATGISGSGNGSGGGGEGAGSTAAGANGAVSAGGATVSTGGDGGDGNNNKNSSGNNGSGPGGGGAGGNGSGDGGSGADGQMILSYTGGTISAAGADQVPTCSATSATLAGNTITGTTGAWTCITNCGGVTIVTPTSPSSQVTGLTVGTATTFRWTLTVIAGGCTTSDDVIITPTAVCPLPNDDPTGAIPLTVGTSCSYTTVTNLSATSTTCGTIPYPSCGSYAGGDVWFSVVVPASGVLNFSSQLGTNADPQIAVYSGAPCGVMTQIACDDDSGIGYAFALSISGQTPGTTLYVRCWRYNTSSGGTFDICVTDLTCPAATILTVNAALLCGQNTNSSIGAIGECMSYGIPTSNTKYYRFTATNDSLVVNLDITSNPSSTNAIMRVFGPFASGAGCNTGCANMLAGYPVSLPTGEFGYHPLLTGLATSGNHDYLVQIEGNNGLTLVHCISVVNPASNNTKFVPSYINNCGVTFNGSTAQGYFASSANGNLDGNNATSCGSCGGGGIDVPYAINNDSWFKFCTVNAGTYNVQFKVGSCLFTTAPGVQMAVLTGTNTAFTNTWNATNPTLPTTALQTSPNFALAAGGCAYLIVDGWNGDACTYSYVLTNVTGGCTILPIELLSFNALQKEKVVELNWATATEINNAYFTIERSDDGVNFKSIEIINGSGSTANAMFYSSVDYNPLHGLSYYRLKQTDYDGKSTYSNIISVNYVNDKDLKFEIIPNPISEYQKINIRLDFIPKQGVSVLVYDINGLLIYDATKKLDSSDLEIPQEFSKGIYLVKIICNEFVETKRMIIK